MTSKDFATVTAAGDYTHGAQPNFSGTGLSDLENPIGEPVNGYTFSLLPGTGSTMTVADNALQEIQGQISMA